MEYQTIFILVLLILLPYKISANIYYEETNHSIESLQKIKVVNDTKICPEESSSKERQTYIVNEKNVTVCEYQYFCHKNENCYKIHSINNINYHPSGPTNKVFGEYLVNIHDITKKLIFVACSKLRYERGMCDTNICVSNTDCFSNNCVNGICMINKNKPAYVCRTEKPNEEKKKYSVKCLLAYEESCKFDDDCTDDSKCTLDDICVIPDPKDPEEIHRYFMLFIIAILLLIGIAFILMAIYYINKYKAKNK